MLSPKSEKHEAHESGLSPDVTIHISDLYSSDLEYEYVDKLITPFLEYGVINVKINNFHFKNYYAICSHCRECLHNENKDSLYLKRNESAERYNIELIQKWCNKNRGKYADLWLGPKVKFHALEDISHILDSYEISFVTKLKHGDENNSDIEICLYQHTKANQRLEPTQKTQGNF